MGEIPEDIEKTAAEVWATLPKESGGIIAIAHAIANERKRCAEVARRAAGDFYGNTDSMLAASLIASRIESGQ